MSGNALVTSSWPRPCIVLRGIAGFGLHHHQSLSLSEDPPVAVITVVTKSTIEGLPDPVLAMTKRGLITLERARLLRDDVGPVSLNEERNEATKVTIYVGRRERVYGMSAYMAVHGDKLFQLTRHVPVVTIVVDTPDNIAASFDIIDELTTQQGLVTSEMVPALVAVDSDDKRGRTQMARHNY